MTTRYFLSFTLFVGALVASSACGPRRAVPKGIPTVASDSIVGIVSIVGTTFEQRVVLRTRNQTVTLVASSPDSAALSHVGGTEIMVRGHSDSGMFRVENFVVVRVDGAPVFDGVLTRDGERLALETATGRVLLGNPPTAFRVMFGARVWVGGPLDTGPNTFGIIVPAP